MADGGTGIRRRVLREGGIASALARGLRPEAGRGQKACEKGLSKAVNSLLDPPKAKLIGPAPRDDDGNFAPYDLYGHDVMWWLDKMVRSNQPLVERMALNWHDWFATGDVGSLRMSIGQANMFRKRAFAGFDKLIEHVTTDPAMLIWLSGIYNTKWDPNENYGRELMELFMLGVSDESGYPYSEDDVREQARALTGWRANWKEDVGYENFRFDREYHDKGTKTIFGQTGEFDWQDSCRLCLEHEAHAPYLVGKLWSYFIPVPPDPATQADARVDVSLELRDQAAPQGDPQAPRLLRGALDGEAADRLHRRDAAARGSSASARTAGPGSPTWPGSARSARRTSRGGTRSAGSTPPAIAAAGSPSTYITRKDQIENLDEYPANETAVEAVDKALDYWGDPVIDSATRDGLVEFGEAVEARDRRRLAEEDLPRPSPERPAGDGRDVPRDADELRRTMACNHCNEFSRAHLLRGAAAEAGKGLPQIEPGMPIPGGHGPLAALVHDEGRPGDDVRLRRLEARLRGPAGAGSRVRRGRRRRSSSPSSWTGAPTTSPCSLR